MRSVLARRRLIGAVLLGALAAWLAAAGLSSGALADLRGHGGPVRALAVSSDGRTAVSGGFDQSVILWRLRDAIALKVLRFHEGAVNAVSVLPDGRFLTGGEDGRIAVWDIGATSPAVVIAAHQGPIAALATSRDGREVASASWDGTVRLSGLSGEGARTFEGHSGNVNAVAFSPDGSVVSAGYDGTVRIWPRQGGSATVVTISTPLNALAVAPDGDIVTAGADGIVRILGAGAQNRAEVLTQASAITSLALSPDGATIAAGSISGAITMLDRARAAVLRTLRGRGGPVWCLAFLPDGEELLAGGGNTLIRRWNLRTGEPVGPAAVAVARDGPAPLPGGRGAAVFEACTACHTLTEDGGNRAGPTLHGIFGRRIASAPGYTYSESLKALDIVWGPDTIAKLFEVGPSVMTPGTKMPEQIIVERSDREALVTFLEDATSPGDRSVAGGR